MPSIWSLALEGLVQREELSPEIEERAVCAIGEFLAIGETESSALTADHLVAIGVSDGEVVAGEGEGLFLEHEGGGVRDHELLENTEGRVERSKGHIF